MGRHKDERHKEHTRSISIITKMIGVAAIVYGILLGLYLIFRTAGSVPSFAIPLYRFVYGVRGWNIVHSWIVPVFLVVLGVIVLSSRRKGARGSKRHDAKSSGVWRRIWGAVRYGNNRSLVIKLLVLVAVLVVVFTIKLPAWAWLGIGVLMAAILPQIIMFVIFGLIGKAIWRR